MRNTTRFQYFISDLKDNPYKEFELNASHVKEFFIIESVENLFLSAELEIGDNQGWFQSLPLTGEETVKVVITQVVDQAPGDTKEIDIIKTINFKIFNLRYTIKRYKLYLSFQIFSFFIQSQVFLIPSDNPVVGNHPVDILIFVRSRMIFFDIHTVIINIPGIDLFPCYIRLQGKPLIDGSASSATNIKYFSCYIL